MGHDEASVGLLHQVTDTHLADRARLGDGLAFGELVRRHVEAVARFTTVVTGDGGLASAITPRAFTDVFDQIGSGDYSIDDPFLPGLLRSARDLARTSAAARPDDEPIPPPPAGTEGFDVATQEAAWALAEPERSIRWLDIALGMDAYDHGLALDLSEDEAQELAERSKAQLGGSAVAVDELLRSIEAELPISTVDEARTTWQAWVATVDGTAVEVPERHRGALLARFEPTATRILRGAAVVLLLAGGAGIVFNGDGSPSASGRAGDEQAATATRTYEGQSIDAPELGGSIDLARSTRHPSSTGPSASGAPASTPGDRPVSTSGSPSGLGGSNVGTGAAGTTGGSAAGGSIGSVAGGSGSGSGGSSGSARGAGTPGATPTAPTSSGPSTPPPAPPTAPPATSPPATPPPATPPVTIPAPPTAPPTAPPAPANPVVDVVTGVVGGVTGTLGGLLGGGGR